MGGREGGGRRLPYGRMTINKHQRWRTVWRFLKKLKIELPYDPAIPLLGIYPEKTIIQKETCTIIFIAALFTIARHGSNLSIHQQMNG